MSEPIPVALHRPVGPAVHRREAPVLMGSDPIWLRTLDVARKVADAGCAVLIEGETGTGKEMMAQYIRAHSPLNDRPYHALNCSAVPAELFESELFGHEKGAFTGAAGRRNGMFRVAHTGILFLDDVPEVPLGLQAKLLRVLQEGTIRPVGEDKEVTVKVRVIASANISMQSLVRAGKMRADLMYRLDQARVSIPPLRARGDDVLYLARFFGERYALAFSPGADELMMQYEWPGNVRELENMVRAFGALGHNRLIEASEINERLNSASIAFPSDMETDTAETRVRAYTRLASQNLESTERGVILAALELHEGNKMQTARTLGINVRTLRSKLNAYRALDSSVP